MKPIIYLDNNATTKVAPEVVQAMLPCFEELYGNASSMHYFGGQMGKYVANAREQVASILGANSDEIIFTSCGTESDNTAINSAISTNPEKRHIITTKVEHSAIINQCQFLETKGYDVTWLSVDEKGQIDLNELQNALTDNTAIVSIMYANNETGTVFPIEKIADIVKANGTLLHVDAVQAVGKIPFDLAKLPIDFLALSGHKLHAPKGIGALYIRNGVRFRPYIMGGHQEFGRRAGTENVPYIIALGKACELAAANLNTENKFVKDLRDNLEKHILATIPKAKVNGDVEHRLPNTTNISFKNVEGEAILLMLDQYGICASSGSACTSGSLEPSHVLRAMGISFDYAHGSVRFSLSRYNTKEEIDKVCEILPKVIQRLRDLSPYKG